MKEITILSGKGGTGKTSITAALASVAKNAVFCDNDVDAADLHLIFQPVIKEEYAFESGWKAEIDTSKCTFCSMCIDYCRFDAIHQDKNGNLTINPFQCEGCRLCERICPEEAIHSERSKNNHWYVSETRFGILVHAKMGPGEENSGKLVTQVRKRAREIAAQNKSGFIINDGPPGIGCPVISSLSGTDIVVMIIEPTMTGLHDAGRLIELVESFNIKTFAIINKSDINTLISKEIEVYLRNKRVPLLAHLPFDTTMVDAMIEGKSIVEYAPRSEISTSLTDIWKNRLEPEVAN